MLRTEVMQDASLADWLTAVGTCGAVIYALYRDTVRVWLRRPKLSVTKGDVERVTTGGEVSYKIPVVVQNCSAKARALKVSVTIQKTSFRPTGNGKPYAAEQGRCAANWDRSQEHQVSIAPRKEDAVPLFILDPPGRPNSASEGAPLPSGDGYGTGGASVGSGWIVIGNTKHERHAGQWTIEFAVDAEGVEQRHYSLCVTWNGGWDGDLERMRQLVQAELKEL